MFRWVSDFEDPTHAMKAIATNCEISPAGEYRDGPFAKSLKWCEHSERRSMVHLMNHMRVKSKSMDASIASEFGTDVHVGYLRLLDEFLINAHILSNESSNSLIQCVDSVGSRIVKRMRPLFVVVEFIDEHFERKTKRFENQNSCMVQLMIDAMNGSSE